MHQAPLADRIDFYRYSSASQLLDQAREILREIQTLDQATTPSWKHNALWTAFFVSYGKVFKQKRDENLKVGLRLPNDVIPSEYRNEHEAIIDLRDKMFAHTDFASLVDDQQKPLNALAVRVINGVPNFALRYIQPRAAGIDNYLKLLDKMIETVAYRGAKIWNRWAKKLKVPPNSAWILNASNASDDILLEDK